MGFPLFSREQFRMTYRTAVMWGCNWQCLGSPICSPLLAQGEYGGPCQTRSWCGDRTVSYCCSKICQASSVIAFRSPERTVKSHCGLAGQKLWEVVPGQAFPADMKKYSYARMNFTRKARVKQSRTGCAAHSIHPGER